MPLKKITATSLAVSLALQIPLRPVQNEARAQGTPRPESFDSASAAISSIRMAIVRASILISGSPPNPRLASTTLRSAIDQLNQLGDDQSREVSELRVSLNVALSRIESMRPNPSQLVQPIPAPQSESPASDLEQLLASPNPSEPPMSSSPQLQVGSSPSDAQWDEALKLVPELQSSLWYLSRAEIRTQAQPQRLNQIFSELYRKNIDDHDRELQKVQLLADQPWIFGQMVEWLAKDTETGMAKSSAENNILIKENPGVPIDELADKVVWKFIKTSVPVGAATGVLAASPKVPLATTALAGATGAFAGMTIHTKMVEQLTNLYGLRVSKVELETMTAVAVTMVRSALFQALGARASAQIKALTSGDSDRLGSIMRTQVEMANGAINSEVQANSSKAGASGSLWTRIWSRVASVLDAASTLTGKLAQASKDRVERGFPDPSQIPPQPTPAQRGGYQGPQQGGPPRPGSQQGLTGFPKGNPTPPQGAALPPGQFPQPGPAPVPGQTPTPSAGSGPLNPPSGPPRPSVPPAPGQAPSPLRPTSAPIVVPKLAMVFAALGGAVAAIEMYLVGWVATEMLANLREQLIIVRNESLNSHLSSSEFGEGLIKLLIAARSSPEERRTAVVFENPKGLTNQRPYDQVTLGEKEEEFILNVVRSAKICSPNDLEKLRELNERARVELSPALSDNTRKLIRASYEKQRKDLLYACYSSGNMRSPMAPWKRVEAELRTGQGIPARDVVSLRSLDAAYRIMIGELVLQLQMLDGNRSPAERDFFQTTVRPTLGLEGLEMYFSGLESFIRKRSMLRAPGSITGYVIHDSPVAVPFNFSSGYTSANSPPVPNQ